MLFLTIVFLAFSLAVLIKGGLFRGLTSELLEEEIKKQKLGTDNYKFENVELGIKTLGVVVFGIIWLIIELVYLCKTIAIDPLYYPSVAALSYFLLALIIGFVFKKKKDYSTEEKIKKARAKVNRKRTIKGTLSGILWVAYFAYMFYVLVF